MAHVDEALGRDVFLYVWRPPVHRYIACCEAIEDLFGDPAVQYHVLKADRKRVAAERLELGRYRALVHFSRRDQRRHRTYTLPIVAHLVDRFLRGAWHP